MPNDMNAPAAVADPLNARPAYRKRSLSGRELLVTLGSLLLITLFVQLVYATTIRPRAAAILAQAEATSEDRRSGAELRSPWVILKDYEQEITIILTLWALVMIVQQARVAVRSRNLLDKTYIDVSENRVVLPEDVRAYGRPIEQLPPEEREMLAPRALMAGLNRFGATRSVHDASEAVITECEFEAARLDAQLSMIRFTAWAIPAIGFVGTVRGIGIALQEARFALQGDISGVTAGLGIAFNSTLVALVLSIFVMFCLHQLQQTHDRLVLGTRAYVDRHLLRHMRVS